ncbi:unnamed protein product [Vicia faba]|uniref:Uncharacterized protein n=1 Tax=Vicia faba TaxID=3906 RepID=A0AAV0YJ14_VICFA|nr:unnamed protein product [Vicia faba]
MVKLPFFHQRKLTSSRGGHPLVSPTAVVVRFSPPHNTITNSQSLSSSIFVSISIQHDEYSFILIQLRRPCLRLNSEFCLNLPPISLHLFSLLDLYPFIGFTFSDQTLTLPYLTCQQKNLTLMKNQNLTPIVEASSSLPYDYVSGSLNQDRDMKKMIEVPRLTYQSRSDGASIATR